MTSKKTHPRREDDSLDRRYGEIGISALVAALRYLGAPVQHQMRAILGAAEEICKAGGTSLANMVRAHPATRSLLDSSPAAAASSKASSGADAQIKNDSRDAIS